jgi:hypothetical protein
MKEIDFEKNNETPDNMTAESCSCACGGIGSTRDSSATQSAVAGM